MSALPPPDEVAGPYAQQYDVYFKRLDPEGTGEIGAMDAAKFLKKSGLSDELLGKIWEMSDPEGKGSLNRAGLFVACKLIALVQCDMPLTIDNARVDCKAPNFGPVDTAPGAPTAPAVKNLGPLPAKVAISFLVKPEEKRKYDALFDQLQPQDEKISGDKVRNVMMSSKLPTAVLGKVWDLSDVDNDGFLNRYEFTVAMHLIFRALQGDKIPDELPPELMPEKVPKPLSAIPNLNGTSSKPPIPQAMATQRVEAVPWVVNAGERLRYNALFKQTDTDGDGFVSGVEIKNVFLQTGLPQNILAHIWNLCDMNQEGKLNPEQFSLAMWLINRKQSGKDPPAALTPDMVPPSMRPKTQSKGAGGIYNNPELEMIATEIQSFLGEKLNLEKELQETEYNLSVRNTESQSLQAEFDTLSSTFKQLTNQRDVAQKRLDDLDAQNASLQGDLLKLANRIDEEDQEINKLRSQAEEQEATLLAQEEEVHGKQRELDRLKEEEKVLLEDIKRTEKEFDHLEHSVELAEELRLTATEQLMVLTEADSHMKTAMEQFKAVEEAGSEGDYSSVTDIYLEPLKLNFFLPDFAKLEKPARPPIPEAPNQMNGSMSDSEPFGATTPGAIAPSAVEWSSTDAFASFDAFSGKADQNAYNSDGDGPPPLVPRPDSGESPTPALPPKNTAAPPRRPPPPKRPPPPGAGASKGAPVPPIPSPPSSEDPFGGESGSTAPNNAEGGGGFADFANFESTDSQFNRGRSLWGSGGGARPLADKFSSGWAALEVGAGSSNGNLFFSDDSALGSSGGPTPTHTAKYPLGAFAGSSSNRNHAKDQQHSEPFAEDPFKDHRYGDPFDLEGADPFQEKFDPFTASVTDAFGKAARKGGDVPSAQQPPAMPAPKLVAAGRGKRDFVASPPSVENRQVSWPVAVESSKESVVDDDDTFAIFGKSLSSNSRSDPFAAASAPAASTSSGGGSFDGNNLNDSFDPFSLKNQQRSSNQLLQGKATSGPTPLWPGDAGGKSDAFSDPFSSSSAWTTTSTTTTAALSALDDPFAPSGAALGSKGWGSAIDFDSAFGSGSTASGASGFGSDPFKPFAATPNSRNQLQKSETVASVPLSLSARSTPTSGMKKKKGGGEVVAGSSSLSRPWGGGGGSSSSGASEQTSPSLTSKASGHHLFPHFGRDKDSGGGSAAKDGPKKSKSYLQQIAKIRNPLGGNVDRSKSAADLAHKMGSNGSHLRPAVTPVAAGPKPGSNFRLQMEELQLQRATEASRKADEDRLRQLQLQEEQDLAVAIALSKAEALAAAVNKKHA